MPYPHEEDHEMSARRSWAIVLLACFGIVAWGLLSYLLIPEPTRHWDLGTLPDVPGESVYSTALPVPGAAVPKQMPALPGAPRTPGGATP